MSSCLTLGTKNIKLELNIHKKMSTGTGVTLRVTRLIVSLFITTNEYYYVLNYLAFNIFALGNFSV